MSWFKRTQPQSTLDLRGAAPVAAAASRRSRQSRPRRRLMLVAGAVALIIAAGAGWLWWQRTHPIEGRSAMTTAVARVGQLMYLPTGETPTYGTVSDKSKLVSQTFFAHAENGDEVLIYEKARLSILYRPSTNKIVNVGPLVVGNQATPYVTSRLAILNGASSPELLDKMTRQVTAAFPNATIVTKGPASRSYPTSIVADLTTKNQPLAEQVADILHVQGGKLPLGEPVPSADLLIIIGQDYR